MAARTAEPARSPSRFAGLTRGRARLVLLLIAVVCAYGVSLARPTRPVEHDQGRHSDARFYRTVIARVKQGEPYAQAAVETQRAMHYPLRPFVVVRPPALATLLALAPNLAVAAAFEILLALVAIGAWAWRLRQDLPGPRRMGWTMFFVFTGVGAAMTGEAAVLFHESWTGLLIALSLVLRTDKRFGAAVLIGLAAALVRELAMPYLLAMALVALWEKRRVEASAFAAALAIALAALAWHAHAVEALTTAQDPVSQGWLRVGGWRFVLATNEWNGMVAVAGPWLAAFLFPLALLGAAGWRDRAGVRVLAVLAGYAAGFFVFGRPENFYWGLMTAPLAGIGLALAPAALADLWTRAKA